jgi:DNA-3-methyladenine glycosylase I
MEPVQEVVVGDDGLGRCWWSSGDPLNVHYHDTEWGRPVADDNRLFEKLSLEGFQSGLSWLTILRKRENFRKAFRSFDISAVARFNARSVERLLSDAGIVRNRAKIEATVNNARRCLDLIDERGSLAAYVWAFEPDAAERPATLDWQALSEITVSPESIAMSKDLKKRGWSFVGPTTVYSFMEAMGIVNDHLEGCQFRAEVESDRKGFRRPGQVSRAGGRGPGSRARS